MRADIAPNAAQMRRLAEEGPDGPVVMVNLLKFRARAQYDADVPEAGENLTGREAYRRYGQIAFVQVSKVGGNVVWGGKQRFVAIGGDDQDWDEVVCVRYPSRAAFLTMAADPDYLKGIYHRDAGLERTVLLCCDAEMKL